MLELSGYGASLAREDSQESQDRLENLAELIGALADYEAREPGASLSGFLDRAALLSETDRLEDDVPVLLLTLHSAKGLEFDAVFLVGLEEGLLPHSRSLTTAEGLEEERRLCYVGMTRAKGVLHLSWARSRQVFGQRRLTEKSRFIDELPAELLERSGGALPADPARRAAGLGARAARDDGAAVDAPPPASADDAAIRPGIKVRHPLFGVGTVLRREGDGADFKVTVSFPGVGAKKLVARYAGLEVSSHSSVEQQGVWGDESPQNKEGGQQPCRSSSYETGSWRATSDEPRQRRRANGNLGGSSRPPDPLLGV